MESREWIPPPFSPHSVATRAKYRREHRCDDCGAGFYYRKKKSVFMMTPHHPSCPTLKRIVAIENAGWCSQCGAEKTRDLQWDESIRAIVRSVWCPNGHGSSMDWVWPEDATQAERDKLGVVERHQNAASN